MIKNFAIFMAKFAKIEADNPSIIDH